MKQISDQTPMTPAPSQNRPDPRVTRILLSLILIAASAALLRTTPITEHTAGSQVLQHDLREPFGDMRRADLTFRTTSGDIHLEGRDLPDLLQGQYSGPKEASIRRSGSHSGSVADLEYVEQYPRGFRGPLVLFGGSNPRLEVELTNRIPLNLMVTSAAGEVQLDLNEIKLNSLRSTTTSGDLRVTLPEQSGMDVHLKTVSGELVVNTENQDGPFVPQEGGFEATSISGALVLELQDTLYRDVTVSGNSDDVKVNLPPVRDLRADVRTISGTQNIEVGPNTTGTLTVQSTSGDVFLDLPQGLSVDVVTSTVSGEVNAGGLMQQGSGRFQSGNGPADLRIQVKTVSGDIHLNPEGGF